MSKYDMILWDFDGTLADTLAGLLRLFNELAAAYDFAPLTDPHAARELPLRQLLKQQRVPVWRLPRLMRHFLEAQQSQMPTTRLYEGLCPLLEELSSCGLALGVVSSNSADNVRACLQANGVEQRFAVVVGYRRLFGKHRALARVSRQRQLDPRRVLYVGDEVRDIEAARRAQMEICSVTWGVNSRTLLARHEPDYLIDRPAQFLDVIEQCS